MAMKEKVDVMGCCPKQLLYKVLNNTKSLEPLVCKARLEGIYPCTHLYSD